jgi:hypothetical protein
MIKDFHEKEIENCDLFLLGLSLRLRILLGLGRASAALAHELSPPLPIKM